CQQYDSDAFTF
nr:immunoglobulin light chain junction region [Macaca mulatta]